MAELLWCCGVEPELITDWPTTVGHTIRCPVCKREAKHNHRLIAMSEWNRSIKIVEDKIANKDW